MKTEEISEQISIGNLNNALSIASNWIHSIEPFDDNVQKEKDKLISEHI